MIDRFQRVVLACQVHVSFNFKWSHVVPPLFFLFRRCTERNLASFDISTHFAFAQPPEWCAFLGKHRNTETASPIAMTHSNLRVSPKDDSTSKTENLIVKKSLSLRRIFPFRRALVQQQQLSSKTAMTTVYILDENDTSQSSQSVEADLAKTVSTQNGTEAFYCPQREAGYLLDQGLDQRAQGRHEDALESLTQALALSHGLDLQPRILWTLVSLCVNNFPDDSSSSQKAVTYLDTLKPHIDDLDDEWIEQEASLPLLNFLRDHGQWSTGLRMARIVKPDVDLLARIHFENAVSMSTDQAMPHLKDALYFCKDDSLKQSILHSMVHAHAAEEEWEEALSCQSSYIESLDGKEDLAQAHADAAELHMSNNDYESALASLDEGLKIEHAVPLLQAKAHILFYYLNKTDEALEIYKLLLGRVSPVDASRLYYTMGRICTKTGRYDEALQYFSSELKITKEYFGKYNMEVSRIFHDIARIYEDCLGEYDNALKYYKKALKVERHAMKLAPELSDQVLETQRCMGRIHYNRGEFGKAVTVSFADDLSASTM